MAEKKKVRESVIAGSWYPGEKGELSGMIDGFLNNAQAQNLGDIRALIAPHAGYEYSGQVAAFSYAQIKGKEYEKVILLAPSHQVYFKGAALTDATHYRTPLGDVPVSEAASRMMDESNLIRHIPGAEDNEHSLEIQLPFLQKVLGEFELVPFTLGDLSVQDREELASLLMKYLDGDTLLVASTDLSHYYPYDAAVEMDKECIDAITSLEIKKAERCEMCGINPVLALMNVAKKLGWKTKLLKYANSGDVTGDYTGVVGYAAIAFYI